MTNEKDDTDERATELKHEESENTLIILLTVGTLIFGVCVLLTYG